VSTDLGARPEISRHIFGLMLEHLGRSINGGICDEQDGAARTDIISALRELRTPNLRWPGGCFADGYHWRDGVGPRRAQTCVRETI
jgi:alpha-N-arabinofuranosidase